MPHLRRTPLRTTRRAPRYQRVHDDRFHDVH